MHQVSRALEVCDGGTKTTYLGHRRCEHDDLIELAHSLHKLVYAWPLDHVDVVIVALDFHGYREVGLVENLSSVSA